MPGLLDSSRFVAGAIVLLAFLVVRGNAISCYDCSSEFDPRCGDPMNPYSLGTVDCNSKTLPGDHLAGLNSTLCRKLVQKISGKVRVIRKCGYIEDARELQSCMHRSGTHDISILYCACQGDLCNASPGLWTSSSLSAPLLAVAALLLGAQARL